jgi:hypothetical protein
MFRARLASVLVAASLAASGGCSLFDHPWFGPRRDCCPSPCNPCCESAGSSPIIDGPVLTPQEHFAPDNGTLPLGSPRLVPTPQSTPMPYTPVNNKK